MSIIEAVILGIIQGLTEFIPVSSSGHLVLLHDAFGLDKGGLTFDVALHVGTLLALVLHFYKDVIQLGNSFRRGADQSRLPRLLVLATLPAVIFGVALQSAVETTFRSSWLVAFNLIIFGAIMLVAENFARRRQPKKLETISAGRAICIGLAQAIAIIPGISRSGSTITAGLFVGLSRVEATRFSFLLAIPITIGATIKVFTDSAAINQVSNELGVFLAGTAAAFVSGLLAIRFLLNFLSKHSLAAFAYYRFALGGLVLVLLVAN